MKTLGNILLLDMHKYGFLCTRKANSRVILPCIDWAVEHSKGKDPIISTFHSSMENSVLNMLLNGTCPIILVLGRSLYKKLPEKLQPAFDANRLLIISLSDQPRISRESALLCNRYICENATDLTFGFVHPDSSLYPLYQDAVISKKKNVVSLFEN